MFIFSLAPLAWADLYKKALEIQSLKANIEKFQNIKPFYSVLCDDPALKGSSDYYADIRRLEIYSGQLIKAIEVNYGNAAATFPELILVHGLLTNTDKPKSSGDYRYYSELTKVILTSCAQLKGVGADLPLKIDTFVLEFKKMDEQFYSADQLALIRKTFGDVKGELELLEEVRSLRAELEQLHANVLQCKKERDTLQAECAQLDTAARVKKEILKDLINQVQKENAAPEIVIEGLEKIKKDSSRSKIFEKINKKLITSIREKMDFVTNTLHFHQRLTYVQSDAATASSQLLFPKMIFHVVVENVQQSAMGGKPTAFDLAITLRTGSSSENINLRDIGVGNNYVLNFSENEEAFSTFLNTVFQKTLYPHLLEQAMNPNFMSQLEQKAKEQLRKYQLTRSIEGTEKNESSNSSDHDTTSSSSTGMTSVSLFHPTAPPLYHE